MSTQDGYEPLFPADWGWQNYEEATKESAAQYVVYFNEQPVYSEEQSRTFREKSTIWTFEQQQEEQPSFAAQEEKGVAYENILGQPRWGNQTSL